MKKYEGRTYKLCYVLVYLGCQFSLGETLSGGENETFKQTLFENPGNHIFVQRRENQIRLPK